MRETKRAFEKALKDMSSRFAAWQVWQDMVSCWAIAIANQFDTGHREAREKQYLAAAERYGEENMSVFSGLLALLAAELEDNPAQDFLGGLFMELGLGNHWKGQFFTPYSVCKMMAVLTLANAGQTAREKGYIAINDPACGAGATLIAAAQTLREKDINYQRQALFAAQDIDATAAMMCYVQLSLLGCAGYVHIGDTLTAPMTGSALFGDGGENTWYTPMFFADIWTERRAIARLKRITEPGAAQRPEAAQKLTAEFAGVKGKQLSMFEVGA